MRIISAYYHLTQCGCDWRRDEKKQHKVCGRAGTRRSRSGDDSLVIFYESLASRVVRLTIRIVAIPVNANEQDHPQYTQKIMSETVCCRFNINAPSDSHVTIQYIANHVAIQFRKHRIHTKVRAINPLYAIL